MKNTRHTGAECSRPRRLIGIGITAGITFAVTALLLLWMADAEARGKPPGSGSKPPPATEPAGRFDHGFTGNGAVYSNNRLYLYGGVTWDEGSWTTLGDFWSLNLNEEPPAWARVGSSRTTPGRKLDSGFACTEGECLLTGGWPGGDDTWVFSFDRGNWSKLNCRRNLCPSIRFYPTLVYDDDHGGYLLFGGESDRGPDRELNDTYFFDPQSGTWTLMDAGSSAVPGRYLASSVAVPGGVVMYGGVNLSVNPVQLGDMYFWNGTSWATITQNGSGPQRLYGHDMAWDGSRIIVAGGSSVDDGTANQQAWSFTFGTDMASGTWAKVDLDCDRTPVRNKSRMAYDAASNTLVFFGGEGDGLTYADLTICTVK